MINSWIINETVLFEGIPNHKVERSSLCLFGLDSEHRNCPNKRFFPGWKKVLVPQSYPSFGDPLDCSLPGSSVHGILQARILECVSSRFSRESSQPRNLYPDPGIFTAWDTREAYILPRVCRYKINKNDQYLD